MARKQRRTTPKVRQESATAGSARAKVQRTSPAPSASVRRVSPVGSGAGASTRTAGAPPEYIMVFREASETKNVAMIESLVGRVSHKQMRGRNVLALHKGKDSQPKVRMFQELGVAAANLTEGERKAMEARDDVQVVKNERRGIPKDPGSYSYRSGVAGPFGGVGGPVQPFGELGWPVQAFGGVGGPPQPFGGVGGPPQPFEAGPGGLVSYVRGYRDALNAIIAQLETTATGSSPVRRADQSGLTYGLAMVGIWGRERKLTGRGVKVAVLDTGIDLAHPDLAGLVADAARLASFVPGETVHDTQGHGTHVAGTLAGSLGPNPQYGVAPGSDLYVGRVLDSQGFGYDSDILEAIEWAIEQGVRVINLSLGSPRSPNDEVAKAYELVAERLLDRRDGALLVAAAGNESQRHMGRISPVGNPAACPSIMAVAAVDSACQVAWFSCGQQDSVGAIDIAAPGVDVDSARVGGGRTLKSGTSMAAPHVAGLAALFLEHDPELTPRQLWDRMLLRARSLAGSAPEDVGRGLAQVPVP